MATTIDTPLPESTSPSPDTRPRGESRRRLGGRRRAWFLGAAVVTAAAAVAVVAVTVGGDDDDPPTGVHSEIVENGSIRAIEGSVEDTVDAPARSVDPALAAQTARLEGQADRDEQAAAHGDREPATAVNPNGPGAPASEHSVDGAGG
jgi:hypothetical protein